jgi:hypothetical protein
MLLIPNELVQNNMNRLTTGLRTANNNWDWWSLLPEALHQVTIVMSDCGIPRSFRHMSSLISANNPCPLTAPEITGITVLTKITTRSLEIFSV